ncbi:MAG TPA: SDR family oxidoreductase [Acidobacteriota bacterium]|nr:SDR family oxidoreductase [Acidobacteriota bacterium]
MPQIVETVLITGASSGIGAELAKLFAKDGANLVLLARRQDRLDELARDLQARYSVGVRTVSADLGLAEAPQDIFERLAHDRVPIDVIVNNAGFGAQGRFADLSLERQMQMIQVNVAALTHLTRLFLPGMLERGRGGILNVASTAGFQPGPGMAVYYATKAYVLHFTEALAEELKGTPIRTTCLAPGPTATEFAAQADLQRSWLFSFGVMDVETVARTGYQGFRQGRLLVIPGAKNRLLAFAVRFSPRAFVRMVAKRLNTVT